MEHFRVYSTDARGVWLCVNYNCPEIWAADMIRSPSHKMGRHLWVNVFLYNLGHNFHFFTFGIMLCSCLRPLVASFHGQMKSRVITIATSILPTCSQSTFQPLLSTHPQLPRILKLLCFSFPGWSSLVSLPETIPPSSPNELLPLQWDFYPLPLSPQAKCFLLDTTQPIVLHFQQKSIPLLDQELSKAFLYYQASAGLKCGSPSIDDCRIPEKNLTAILGTGKTVIYSSEFRSLKATFTRKIGIFFFIQLEWLWN